ncbi:PREDICTED: photosystem II 5 kDa protein, chloroplastic-like [Tarenaya hassleriana]|uniref:photosystem II 5 kDa protein, chloroplastic-like n=1 Tax=Tarenaya hassleriana TaxID=28532 RepID=UPI00053C0935|nr:PREDICTED: photosystem II 5 kDa protein, chloroplastic-like [Tarenaya hassleriana]
MASMTMTASCLPSSAVRPPSNAASVRRSLAVVRASTGGESSTAGIRAKESTVKQEQTRSISMRRDLMFAAAVTAAATLAKAAMAEDEPKRGTEGAKKKYAPICVTMPTAKICHK